MNYFKVVFNSEEKQLLFKHNILINNNLRYYLFDEREDIPVHGVPHQYIVENFEYKGTSWKSLLISFGNWFIKKCDDVSDYIYLKNRFQKAIFSRVAETNFAGPLENGLYINNNLGVKSWQQIIDLLNFLDIQNKGIVVVHYPFQRENEEIGKLFWKKEINLFYRYLLGLGYSKELALKHIFNVKKLSVIYKEGKKSISSWYGVMDVSNPFFITADSKQDLSNAISQIKGFKGYKEEFSTTIENIMDFKDEMYYENKNYSSHNG
jgi:hypothetical protein